MKKIIDIINKLLKEDTIEPTNKVEGNFNSPVWPVQKSNSQWRFTIDYKNINQLSPQMWGNLPNVEDIFLKIRNYNIKFFGIIDLSDMFFSIPLHVDSRDVTTFTWNKKQFRFKRVPQGYTNSPMVTGKAT